MLWKFRLFDGISDSIIKLLNKFQINSVEFYPSILHEDIVDLEKIYFDIKPVITTLKYRELHENQ